MLKNKTWQPVAGAAAILCLLHANTATALGLGEIGVDSYLYQRFEARIPLLTPTEEQRQTLSVRLAGADEFERAGIERSEYLSTLQLELADGPDGPRIVIHSDEIARAPYLNLIVEVNWAGGRLMREYTVLFDPPPITARPSTVVAAAATPPARQVAAEAPPPQRPLHMTPLTLSAAPAPSRDRYGPVRAHEAPRVIAGRLYRHAGVSLEQKELALYQANPQAFSGGLLGRLIPGSMLRVPALSEIQKLDPGRARIAIDELRQRSGVATPHRPARPRTAPAAAAPIQAAVAPPPPVTLPQQPEAVKPAAQPMAVAPSKASREAAAAAPSALAAGPTASSPPRLTAAWFWLGSALSLLIGLGLLGLPWLRRRLGAREPRLVPQPLFARLKQPLPELPAPVPAFLLGTAPTPPATVETETAPDLRNLLADVVFWQQYGNHDAAISALAEAVAQQPQDHELRFKLAEACFVAGLPERFREQAAALHGKIGADLQRKLAEMESSLDTTQMSQDWVQPPADAAGLRPLPSRVEPQAAQNQAEPVRPFVERRRSERRRQRR
jgi:FimV-like protein